MEQVCLRSLLPEAAGATLKNKIMSIHNELTYFILSVRTAHRIFGMCLAIMHNLSHTTSRGHGGTQGESSKCCVQLL